MKIDLFCMKKIWIGKKIELFIQMCIRDRSSRDRGRLESLSGNARYRDVIAYMLEHNVKLEQEIISYYEKGKGRPSVL